MAATIKDVARCAEVSISTVSRVMNRNYPVSDEVREKVERAIEKTGYKTNALAGGLRTKTSKLIAIAIPGVANTLYMEIVRGVQKVADERNYTLVVVDTGEDDEKEQKVLDNLLTWQINGLIIAPASPKPKALKDIKKSNINVVVVDRDVGEYVNTDRIIWKNYETARKLTKHLIENGHEKIALICAQNRFSVGFDRKRGYLDELKANGIEPQKELYDNTNFSIDEAYETARTLMESDDPPTAYIGLCFYCTKAIMKAARDLGLRIPEDVSVASFSKFDLNEYYYPKITNVEEDLCEMGEKAARLLFDRIDEGAVSKETKTIVMTADMVARDSVKNIKGE